VHGSLPVTVALVVSVGSLLVSIFTLGWNVYRDVILKPRLRVSLMNGVITAGEANPPRRVVVTIVNLGPAKIEICGLYLRQTGWWRGVLRRRQYAFLRYDFEDALSGKIPCRLDVGEQVHLTFRYTPQLSQLFLTSKFGQLGAGDTFGRYHWSTRKNYREVKEGYVAATAKEDGLKINI
jgi:hypothetical protein